MQIILMIWKSFKRLYRLRMENGDCKDLKVFTVSNFISLYSLQFTVGLMLWVHNDCGPQPPVHWIPKMRIPVNECVLHNAQYP